MALVEQEHPRDYDYDGAQRRCDVVMKGGITSGVVYPHAVCELARAYRFKNVGGTSAGAIAAALTAAAELGRASGGFRRLADLPDDLTTNDTLRNLFQPQESTEAIHRLLMESISDDAGKLRRVAAAAGRSFPGAAAAGAAPGAGLVAAAIASDGHAGLRAYAGAAGLVLALGGAAAGVAGGLFRKTTRDVPENFFGICSGMGASEPEPLTPWLERMMREVSGGLRPERPLTFGNLWAGPGSTAVPADEKDRHVHLEMVSTNLTNRRSERLPFAEGGWFFDPGEFAKLFPEAVVDWMRNNPAAPGDDEVDSLVTRALMRPLLPLPDPQNLPVIVATRMSLSFPVLLSAIPLYRYDMEREDNQARRGEWRDWADDLGEDREAILAGDVSIWPGGQPTERPETTRYWFSDGGIASNFPIHFFDSFLPRWPTFGINLRPFAPYGTKAGDETENVSMPATNLDGINEWVYDVPAEGGPPALAGFLNGVVRTMQNRVDEAQMRMPGYRDRIVHIHHDEDEGGMNLSMPEDRITALTARGRAAGVRLVDAYTAPAEGARVSWENHRWVRLRITLAALEDMLIKVRRGFAETPQSGERSYPDLFGRAEDDPPTSYAMSTELGDIAEGHLTAAAQALDTLAAEQLSFLVDAPQPAYELRLTPKRR